MAGCCGCCSALKPRYKRLVDNIFPENPQDGLVKNEMEKLTYFAISSPQKLDRIGVYLEQRLSRDIYRHRDGYVFIAMEALDKLLVSCHSHSLNLFVESFLKMVQKLLECHEPDLQILATQSFVKFTNIEEDTPSYHRRYDFFVSKFSSMCHCSNDRNDVKLRIRSAGLRGLQGVVHKTVSDDLQVNIWEPVHMDKIVPSLLYNMSESRTSTGAMESPVDEEHPAYISEQVFRDLICRASYGNIKSALKPVLVHMDNHNLWVPNDFAVKCFKIIMYSVKQQYGYLVIQILMSHLDDNVKSDPAIKTSIIDVLFQSVLIAAEGALGASVLDVFNTLLKHLRLSVDNRSSNPRKREMEVKFEESTINMIGEFANNLPDYQKIEIMMFVMGKFPQFDNEEIGVMDLQLQKMLLKTLLKVATKYKTILIANAFPPEFLTPLLRISLLEDPSMRIIVQEILHTLIDRHNNAAKLKTIVIPNDVGELELEQNKTSGQDSIFMKRNGNFFYTHLFDNMQFESNKVDNFEALYCTMGLIALEMGTDEILIEMLRLALDIQQSCVSSTTLPVTHKCAIHGLLGAFFNLVAHLMGNAPLCQYVKDVVDTRKNQAPYLLPDFAYNRKNRPSSTSFGDMDDEEFYSQADQVQEVCLFDQTAISDHLSDCGQDVTRLATPITFRSLGSADGAISLSASDIGSIMFDMESLEGSPQAARKREAEEITVESLKKMLAENNSAHRAEEERKRKEIYETYKTATYEEIVARSEAKSAKGNKLPDLIEILSRTPDSSEILTENPQKTIFDVSYPDLFVY